MKSADREKENTFGICQNPFAALGPLLAWHNEVVQFEWEKPNDIKDSFRSADVINNKRVVFNIKGNDFRLIVDIEYRLKIVFVVAIFTHAEYDKIDVKNIRYEG